MALKCAFITYCKVLYHIGKVLPLPYFISLQKYLINIHYASVWVFLNDSTKQHMINGNVVATLFSRRDKENVASQKNQRGLAEASESSVMWQGMRHHWARDPPQDEGDQAAQGQSGPSSLHKWLLTAAKWMPFIVLERQGGLCIKLFSPKAMFYVCQGQSILIKWSTCIGLLRIRQALPTMTLKQTVSMA